MHQDQIVKRSFISVHKCTLLCLD